MSEYKVKAIFVGEQYCGKTSIINRYINGLFTENTVSTIGAGFVTKLIERDDAILHLNIWDTAGQETFDSLTSLYYRESDIVFITLDCLSKKSLQRAKYFLQKVRQELKNPKIILAVNKIDKLPSFSRDNLNESLYKECSFYDELILMTK